MKRVMLAATLAAALGGCATLGADAPVRIDRGVLVDHDRGMTLYTFDRDPRAKSACVAQCAANWPPFLVPSNARVSGDFSVVTREDGARQWAYKDKPLYFWVKDGKPGDHTGDGVNNLWRVARP